MTNLHPFHFRLLHSRKSQILSKVLLVRVWLQLGLFVVVVVVCGLVLLRFVLACLLADFPLFHLPVFDSLLWLTPFNCLTLFHVPWRRLRLVSTW